MKLLTIITPTYNRVYLLRNAYESLLSQTNKDFVWLVVDDGSTDNTKELIDLFRKENLLEIRYVYKQNGGKHTALNIGFDEADSELVLILDSDDTLTESAVQIVYEKWNKWREQPRIGQLSFLRAYTNGKIIGDLFPEDEYVSNQIKVMINGNIKGDKCKVFRTSVLKQFKFPIVENERFMGESVVWNRIGREYDCVYYNTAIYVTEYLVDGLTKAGKKMHIKNPLGGMIYTNELLEKDIKLKMRLKETILFDTYGFFARIRISDLLEKSHAPFLSFICLPVSYVLFLYWKNKYQ